MKAVINRNIFAQVNSDSGSLTSLSSVVHKFSKSGEFYGTVLRGQDVVGQFSLTVSGSEDEKASQPERHDSVQEPSQVHIDLRDLHLPAEHDEKEQSNHFIVGTGGYAVFQVSAGSGGYAVLVHAAGESGAGPKVFDSRELREEDLLSTRVLRPGIYSVANKLTRAKAKLTVAYPEKLPKKLIPMRVECGRAKFSPDVIKIQPTQGLIFSFRAPSRIKIE